jgi:hypothetical protein
MGGKKQPSTEVVDTHPGFSVTCTACRSVWVIAETISNPVPGDDRFDELTVQLRCLDCGQMAKLCGVYIERRSDAD